MNSFCFLKRVFHKSGLPLQLVVYVTAKCDFACSHCFLNERRQLVTYDLSLSEIDRLTQTLSPLWWLCLTGGEPFLRPDLAEVAGLFYQNAGVIYLTIPTNGFTTPNIITQTEKIAKYLKRAQVIIQVSLDGFKETHDRIRKQEGSFTNALATLKYLKALKKHQRNLKTGILSTYMPQNQSGFGEFLNFIQTSIRPDIISVNLIRSDTLDLHHNGLAEKYFADVTRFWKSQSARLTLSRNPVFKRALLAKDMILCDLIRKTYSGPRPKLHCYAGVLGALVREDGEVFPCEERKHGFGNLRNFQMDFRSLWNSEKARLVRKGIRESRCSCTWECALNTNIIFNPRYYGRLIKNFLTI